MPRNTALIIGKKIKELAQNPDDMLNVKKLTDHPGCRLRVGDWRIIYTVNDNEILFHINYKNSRRGLQMSVQIIEKNGKPEWAVIPFQEYKKIQEALEDADDIKEIEENLKAISDGSEMTVPGEVTFAILDGTNPIRAWREYRKIKMSDLSNKVGISSSYLSQIENGKRNPTIDTLRSIAKELEIDIDMLI